MNRWDSTPLPEDRFVNMGAFGSNTMSFEQWLQFVLLPRIQEITRNNGSLPGNSSVGTYAIRALDGDTDAEPLMDRLFELDSLINNA